MIGVQTHMTYDIRHLVTELEMRANEQKEALGMVEAEAIDRINSLTDVRDDAERIAANLEEAVNTLNDLGCELDAALTIRQEAEELGIEV